MHENHSDKFSEQELEETNKTFQIFISFFRDLIIILIIVVIIRTILVTPFRINGSSMESNYHDKEYILVDKLTYLDFTPDAFSRQLSWDSLATTLHNGWNDLMTATIARLNFKVSDPKRGDVVVITPHVDKNREYYIKRVIGLPGETIRFSSGRVFIKQSDSEEFTQLYEPYLSLANSGNTYLQDYIEWDQFRIPDNMYWIMGDNRNNSADSRSCFRNCFWTEVTAHFIKRRDIIGKVLLNFWYINLFSADGVFRGGPIEWTYPPRFLSHPREAVYPELQD